MKVLKRISKRRTGKPSKKPRIASYLNRLKSVVKQEIKRNTPDQENRIEGGLGLYSYPGSAHGTTMATNLWVNNNIIDVTDVWMNIAQGTGEGNRFGNVIKPRKLNFSFLLAPNQAAITSPINVRMWVLTYKFGINNASDADVWDSMQNFNATGGMASSFFDNGNSRSGMSGNLDDLMKPVNTDAWMVYKCKTYKLGHSSTPAVGTAVYGNNDYKLNVRKTINLLPYIPKRITYNDNLSTNLNKKVFIVFECLKADGSSNNNTTQYAVLWYNFHFKWEST